MRIHSSTGLKLLLYPSYWGLGMGTAAGCLPDVYYLSLFALGALAMRGAGCTINDLLDRKYDALVTRTKDRPIASGQISIRSGVTFLAAELSVAAAVLFQFDWYSIALGTSSLVLVGLYPLCKRVTYWPQLVLGLTFNWGVLLGWSVVNSGHLYLPALLPLYASAVSWTMIYDTIYAHQDREDDIAIGLKSTAIMFGDKTKYWLSGLSVAMTSGLLMSGVASDQLWPYYAAVALTSGHLVHQIVTLDINDRDNCWKLFRRNSQIGLILFIGIVISNYMKDKKPETKTHKT